MNLKPSVSVAVGYPGASRRSAGLHMAMERGAHDNLQDAGAVAALIRGVVCVLPFTSKQMYLI